MIIRDRHVNLLVAAAFLALLPLGYVQFRWISEVSEAEQLRRRADLAAPLDQIAAEVDRDFGRLLATLVAGFDIPAASIPALIHTWDDQSQQPPLGPLLLFPFDRPWTPGPYYPAPPR